MAKAKNSKTTYQVTKRVLHDGKHLRKGDTLELADEHAAPLIELGAIKASPEQNDAAAAE